MKETRMTPQQISLVQSSFENVKPIAQQAGRLFYDRLFAVDPSLRRMFRSDPAEQARLLMQVLAVAVNSLARIEQLVPTLEQMGSRHAGYGVQDRHYETVGACLLWTLEQGLGADFTPAVRDAWIAAYDLLAGTMKHGAVATATVSC
jgi:hemoglobin-like flavoprotein